MNILERLSARASESPDNTGRAAKLRNALATLLSGGVVTIALQFAADYTPPQQLPPVSPKPRAELVEGYPSIVTMQVETANGPELLRVGEYVQLTDGRIVLVKRIVPNEEIVGDKKFLTANYWEGHVMSENPNFGFTQAAVADEFDTRQIAGKIE